MQEFQDIDGVLFDLDGTLISGGKVLPWAHDLIEASRGNFAIVTNDAEHTTVEIASIMNAIGIAVPEDRIVAAGMEAIRRVAEEMPGARSAIFASASLREYASSLGLHVSDDRPDIVIIGRDRNFSYETIRKAANGVLAGAKLVVCNPDRTHPGQNGQIVPETGALVAAIIACTGPTDYRVIGKPEPELFVAGMKRVGSEPSRTLMVGDNPDTDGRGARLIGMQFLKIGPRAAVHSEY
ncbi:HAD family hydrolase [Rhizobium pusense]|uniref:HAD-IIA family hydrolase n=1 Tax=Agrobacterium pusense TaxID=648995 RepID=UPI000D1B0CE3|nr:HAD family hydrolase [Agrobacterium pusense]MDH0911147.1 HAD family hydrolase [Agrobacterium pusense]MDH1097216.1 HAD family hydrolase [Agrobacterium pusense]MDH1113700.1 HAD family hydrolase [Agrobacterium pusense]MDH2193222.1 HAD family hydrolase [Agrobacterium pusense]